MLFNVKGVFYTIIISLIFIYCQYIKDNNFKFLYSFKAPPERSFWSFKTTSTAEDSLNLIGNKMLFVFEMRLLLEPVKKALQNKKAI